MIQDTVPAGCYMVNYPYDPSLAVEAASTLKEVSGARVIVQLSADELCHIGSVDGVYLTPSYKTAATVEEALRIVRAKNSAVDLVCNIDMPSKQLSPSAAAERVRKMFEIGCTVGVISPWIDWNEAKRFLEQSKIPLPRVVQAIYPEVTTSQWEEVRGSRAVSQTIYSQLETGGNVEKTSSAIAQSRLKEAMTQGAGAWIDLSTAEDIETAFQKLNLKQ